MSTKAQNGTGSIVIDGERYGTKFFTYEGTQYTVRELSVDEGDDIAEAATGPDKLVNGRLNTRMLLSKAMVEPTATVEQIGKFGGRKFGLILRAFNEINTVPEANPTVPAGSAGPTSPSGGEPSPQP